MAFRRNILGGKQKWLLDYYPMAPGSAWSLRRLSTPYTGACIKVRRSSDNIEINIGFKNGLLDVAALLAFAGNGNGFVTTWYDQAGGHNLVQTEAARQPQIVATGSLIVQQGLPGGYSRPAIRFDGVNDYFEVAGSEGMYNALHNAKALVTVVARAGNSADPNMACGFVDTGGAVSTNVGYSIFFDDRVQFNLNNGIRIAVQNGSGSTTNVISSTPDGAFQPNKLNVLMNTIDASNPVGSLRSMLKVNNDTTISSNSNSASPAPGNATRTLKVGAVYTNLLLNYHNGTMQEVLVYLNDQSATRPSIRNNINSHYSIY